MSSYIPKMNKSQQKLKQKSSKNQSQAQLQQPDMIQSKKKANQLKYIKENYVQSSFVQIQSLSQHQEATVIINDSINLEILQNESANKANNDNKDVQCQICLSLIVQSQLKPFSQNCKHYCCKSCLELYINHEFKKFQPIKCFDSRCKSAIDQKSYLYQQFLPEQRHKYDKIINLHQINKHPNRKACPKDGCNGYLITDKKPVKCMVCHQKFCKECLFNKHKGTCDDNTQLILQGSFRYARCSRCKIYVQKKGGCNHMTCRCGKQFCYICSADWVEQHKCGQQQIFHQQTVNAQAPIPQQNCKLCLICAKFLCIIYMPFLFLIDLFILITGPILAIFYLLLAEIVCCYLFAIKFFYNECTRPLNLTQTFSGKAFFLLLIFLACIFPIWVQCNFEYKQQRRNRLDKLLRQQFNLIFPIFWCICLKICRQPSQRSR